jgi:SNF2 family DNA or RNA helicase
MISFQEGQEVAHWLIVGDRKVKTFFLKEGTRVWVTFGFNRPLLEEIKAMDGARWHGYDEPPVKKWSIRDNARNRFQLSFLAGYNPYSSYELPLIDYTSQRTPYKHQHYGTRFMLTRHYCIYAAEMGVGKSLAAIEAMEQSGLKDWWWIAPKSALAATYLELDKWKSKIRPELYTYDSLKKVLENWQEGQPPPQGVIFDECSRVKNPTAQRSQAALHLANSIRDYYGDNGYVILMSGSPAPKSPADWWHLCEIACPGFIREGTHQKFQHRLAVTQKTEGAGGGFYNNVVAWKDNDKRCNECGQLQDHADHDMMKAGIHFHPFIAAKNEVAFLYERMKGLVEVVFKKDCLELPDKVYRLIKLKPSLSTVQAAKLMSVQYPGAAEKLVRLRELSDGFQYQEVKSGTEPCVACGRTGTINGDPCISCGGKGETDTFSRTYTTLPTPKEDALIDLLDEHEEVGRLVVYAAFTASIDRVVEICKKYQWDVIRVDGRGWHWSGIEPKTDVEMLKIFQRQTDHANRVVFVGHPGSAGMGLTLTASPTIVYWSNDFNAESRIQSEDRIHRAGMDVNRGATIIDLVHLPTDKLVLDNLKKKRELQSITLGELQECLNG